MSPFCLFVTTFIRPKSNLREEVLKQTGAGYKTYFTSFRGFAVRGGLYSIFQKKIETLWLLYGTVSYKSTN